MKRGAARCRIRAAATSLFGARARNPGMTSASKRPVAYCARGRARRRPFNFARKIGGRFAGNRATFDLHAATGRDMWRGRGRSRRRTACGEGKTEQRMHSLGEFGPLVLVEFAKPHVLRAWMASMPIS